MPFSRQNIFFTSMLAGVVLLVIASIISVVVIARTANPPVGMVATVVGIPSVLVMQLLQMMRVEQGNMQTREGQQQTREEIKEVIKPIAEEVKITAEEVKITAGKLGNGGNTLPVNREDLKEMITEIVERVCSDRGILKEPPPREPRVQT